MVIGSPTVISTVRSGASSYKSLENPDLVLIVHVCKLHSACGLYSTNYNLTCLKTVDDRIIPVGGIIIQQRKSTRKKHLHNF